MINNRNLSILTLVLVVLGGVYFWQQAAHRSRTGRPSSSVIIAGSFTKDDLSRVTVGRQQNEAAVDLVRTPTGWVVASSWDTPASGDRIDALLKALSGLAGEFRSDEASVLPDYGLDPQTAVVIKGYGGDGQPAFALEVGNGSQGQPGNFVRLPGQNTVYLSGTGILSQLGLYGGLELPKARHFLDLQAVKEDRLNVDRIVLVDQGKTLDLEKEFANPPAAAPAAAAPAAGDTAAAAAPAGPDRLTWEWRLTAPKRTALAKTKADGVLGSLVNIRAADVDDPTLPGAVTGLDDPARTATLVLQDGSALVLEFGAERAAEGDRQAGTWMRIQGRPTLWVVTEYTTKNIFKTLDDLLPEK